MEIWRYVDLFDEDYLTIYLPGLTAERTERETYQVFEWLGLPPDSAILLVLLKRR